MADTIRSDFTVITAPDLLNREIGDTIRGCEAVSLHVRRGDYISNASASQHHADSSMAYYTAAIAEMSARLHNPHFFVFSDETAWVKENMRVDVPTIYVDHNGPEKGYEDLRLMSLCRHHIIANSSFSWWGAWLATYPGKIVIAPRQWFKRDDIDTSDLIPESWLRL